MITGAVEGDLDEAILRRLAVGAGTEVGLIFGREGKPALLRSLRGYNSAAMHHPWVVLVDLDQECECAADCVQGWLENPSANMRLRAVVQSIESWLLADRERIAEYLSISVKLIPANPDSLPYPKQTLIDLARRSRRRAIREDLVPTLGSGRSVGRLYNASLIGFVNDHDAGWRPDIASANSPSLAKCIERISELV